MEIFPSIDLRDGKVVRLSQGDYDRQQVYATDAAGVAGRFVSAGAKWIHVVDLDAARSGKRTNTEAIGAICRVAGAKVQLGGGIRNDEAVANALALGVNRFIIGSAALKDWAWFGQLARRKDLAGKVVLGLDARGGRLAADGWTDQTDLTVAEVSRRAGSLPLAAIIYTDIERDGMLTGPDLDGTAEIIEATGLPVIASGGIAVLDDIMRCKEIGCAGAIVGRAYYEGKIDLARACALATKEKNR
ncbi:MAG: 1-(5-phosphoribosyl)-5-[(5-phosphoribosylamino)methylideneamino]imidazole-4-carboxamide isomerase [Planctomycetota bacterium]|nr:1-(5-phosphoribosyl)-5-[(5-phosphoribosylamino)methylideneamino]imidazole-4-carboxamide isomerase [Planctomycetota bacterium]